MFGFLKNKLPPHVSTEAADELIDCLESLRIEGSNGWDAVETLESSHDYYEWADLKLIAGFAGSRDGNKWWWSGVAAAANSKLKSQRNNLSAQRQQVPRTLDARALMFHNEMLKAMAGGYSPEDAVENLIRSGSQRENLQAMFSLLRDWHVGLQDEGVNEIVLWYAEAVSKASGFSWNNSG